jgi:hypothetical protein
MMKIMKTGRGHFRIFAFIVTVWLIPCHINAGCLDDVGYTDLQTELGERVPDGTGVTVAQVEGEDSEGDYMPSIASVQFSGKTIENKTGTSEDASNHATAVATYYYGNTASMAGGITDILAYEFNGWIVTDYLALGWQSGGNPIQPIYDLTIPVTLASPARITNHSWVGGGDSINGQVLRRVDFVAEADQAIHIAAVNNGSVQYALMCGAYNVITVGRTDEGHATGTVSVDGIYGAGRACPLLVVPKAVTSYSAPVAAAACALLVEAGEDETIATLTDPEATVFSDRSGRTIRASASSALVKALLLAGAERVTRNTTDADIVDYRSDPDTQQTDNGLDVRFGAGQLNIFNSYRMLENGENNSMEDDASGGGLIDGNGFDVDPVFGGGSGSNRTASYFFTAQESQRRLYVSLAWHLSVDGGSTLNWDDTAVLHNLDLFLYDITNSDHPVQIAGSTSSVENTENLWSPLVPGRHYMMEVVAEDEQEDFERAYALAWRMTTPPDSDSDGVPDDWEVQFGLDHLYDGDVSDDDDGDGLDNRAEYIAGTDIARWDTDGDGASDGLEIELGSDPLDSESLPHIDSVPASEYIFLGCMLGCLLMAGNKTKK